MKQVMYGTVSALALMLAVTGAAMAVDDGYGFGRHESSATGVAVASSDLFDFANCAIFTEVQGNNGIDGWAFQNAAGAFNVGQNASVNSAVGQSMAVAAITGGSTKDTAVAIAGGSASADLNNAAFTSLTDNNGITDWAFQNAKGAFNVLQNASVNSSVQQDMAVAAIVDPPFGSTDKAVAVSELDGCVTGNSAIGTAIGGRWFSGNNTLTYDAFQNAKGAFNVLQNASVNSSVQQSMAVGVITK